MSLREIAKQTGIPKTTIRQTLNAKGMALRNYVTGRNVPDSRSSAQKPGRAPFGYAYLDGRLEINPKEYSTVKQILNLWKSGKKFNAIAVHLNTKKIPSRNQTNWTRSVIRAIVLRHKSGTSKTERK
jgi:DNA invertase Pin-like site-specific DNA recombinase